MLGGRTSDFRVSLLHGRVFKFVVSSKQVDFQIYKLGSYSCDLFKLYFHLWGNGGPAWIRETRFFAEEELKSWTHVPSRRPRSYAAAVKNVHPLTGANQVPIGSRGSVFYLIKFPRVSAFQRLDFSTAPQSLGVEPPVRNSSTAKNTDEHVSNSNAGLNETAKNAEEHIRNSNAGLNEAVNLDLNLGGAFTSSTANHNQASDIPAGPFCSHCLSHTHVRRYCRNTIRCFTCMRWGTLQPLASFRLVLILSWKAKPSKGGTGGTLNLFPPEASHAVRRVSPAPGVNGSSHTGHRSSSNLGNNIFSDTGPNFGNATRFPSSTPMASGVSP